LGTFVPGGFPELSNQMFGVNLLEQTIAETPINGHAYRTFSDNAADWTPVPDGIQDPNPSVHAGWYVDFPTTPPGERVFKGVQIRDAKAFVISFIPDASPCSGGGNSFLYIMDACTGGRLETGQFEIGTSGNLIQIGTDVHGDPIMAAPTGKAFAGTLHEPKIIRRPGTGLERLYMSSSAGVVETEDLPAERRGVLYWLER
jgi:type IV pilus assembly protein PilY1